MNMSKWPAKGRSSLPLLFLFVCFAASLVLLGCLSVSFRVDGMTWRNWLPGAGAEGITSAYYTVWHVRAPRAGLSVLLGSALAVAGCLLQAVTRNPLADTEIMGINQGASCFAVLAIMMFGGTDSSSVIWVAALCGAGVCGLMVHGLARHNRGGPQLVLAGVAISAFAGSLTTGTILLYETQLTEIMYWMAGKLSGATWSDDQLILFLDGPAIIVSLLLSRSLNVLVQGDEVAASLGIHVTRIRSLLGFLVIVLAGSAVAVAGPIGFIGLIVPHMARRLGGTNHFIVLPLAALLGANLLTAADFAAQWITYPAEIPVGIVTAFLGVPFFLYLLRRKGGMRS